MSEELVKLDGGKTVDSTGSIIPKVGRPKELDPAKSPGKVRRAQFEAFIRLYRSTASFGASCEALNVDTSTIKTWMNTWPVFQAMFDDARIRVLGQLEAELYQRAVVGWEEPLVSMGRVVTHMTKKSDKLLEFALRANDPKRYSPQNQRTIGAEMGVDDKGNKYFKVYEGFNTDEV